MKKWASRAAVAASLACLIPASAEAQFYTNTGSPVNPRGSTIFPKLNNNTGKHAPVYGSVINFNNAATEVGLYGNLPISGGTQRIHVCCNTSSSNFTASDQDWAGFKSINPGGSVTINGTATLGLDDSGVDMSTATRCLVVNCPVELTASGPWVVAATPTATFNGTVRGYAGITSSGGGTVVLNAANSITGPTAISAGPLQLGNGGTTGSLYTSSASSVITGATFAVWHPETRGFDLLSAERFQRGDRGWFRE